MTNRTIARIVGMLFLTAMVASLLGGGLLEAPFSTPEYLRAIAEQKTQVIIGVLLELINGIAVVGIGVLMFHILQPHNARIALGYLSVRIIEAVFCSMIVISPLALITLSEKYVNAGASDAAYFQMVGMLALAERASVADLLIPVFFGIGALLLYTALYQSRLLPRWLAVWGFIGAILILTLNLVSLQFKVNLSIGLMFALPMILNEIVLGIWLIVKGFNPSAFAAGAEKQS
jgi:hypothetical protein